VPEPAKRPDRDSHALLAQEVIQQLVAMSGRLTQFFASRAAEFGLSTGEGKVLLNLQPGETSPMRTLARRLGYDASNLTGIIDRLEDRGALERRAEPADRRVKAIALTDRGQRLRDDFSRRLTADAGPVEPLTEAQLRELRRLLNRALEP
jgi:DNA-binding MarR family transcriptional regulator